MATFRVTKPSRRYFGPKRRPRQERAEQRDRSRVKESMEPSGGVCTRPHPEFVQRLLGDEVTMRLGRAKSAGGPPWMRRRGLAMDMARRGS